MRWTRGAWMAAAMAAFVACLMVPVAITTNNNVQAGQKQGAGDYRVLEPMQSGALTLFPVVRNAEATAAKQWEYLTLDEGLRSGQVEVTEAGRVRGMVRPRRGQLQPVESYRGDQVNTLVLLNHSERPLLLLAGEIVTGGKQDRVIAKDRIVPAHSEPLDLSVFCIEHGRWTEVSDRFGAVSDSKSFMVQPSVRGRAMVQQDQQQVWNSVEMARTAVPGPTGGDVRSAAPTTSYAKTMLLHESALDRIAEPLTRRNQEVLQKLREQHAVGVVVAVHGEIIWADVFATPEMLAAYWTKLVRSYAAESFDSMRKGKPEATVAEAQNFLNRPATGEESSEGESGIYRYLEVRGRTQSSFYLQVLLGGADFYAHISRVAEEGRIGKFNPICAGDCVE
jgi:hypothetical protein